MTKDEHFKLCPTLVQEQVYAWVIASSFVCSWKPPRYGGRHILETELVYRDWGIIISFYSNMLIFRYSCQLAFVCVDSFKMNLCIKCTIMLCKNCHVMLHCLCGQLSDNYICINKLTISISNVFARLHYFLSIVLNKLNRILFPATQIEHFTEE